MFVPHVTAPLIRPDQITAKYSQLFNSSFTPAYGIYNGMVAAADDLYGNMTKKLREKQMYERTVIIMSADNGGPASIYSSSHAANNWPLRGGKKT
jgi:arylsulfatase A-like enzyme|eukprot:COSAG02_NODE_1915_length_10394_cov_5.038757_8_plen_95_part_00